MNRINIIGERYSSLEVLSYSHTNKRGVAFWNCICDCGNNSVKSGMSMKSGITKSCGCLKQNYNIKRSEKYQIGQRYEMLEVLKYMGKDLKNKTSWLCRCDCGREVEIKSSALPKRKSCGCMKVNNLKGKANPNWNHNLSDQDRMILNNRYIKYGEQYKNWHREILERDDGMCQISLEYGEMEVHHLYSWNSHPDLRFDIDNGITISKKLHREFHSKYGKGNNTPEQFYQFKEQVIDPVNH